MEPLYNAADAQLQGRNYNGRKIANNTYLERIDADTIGVRLHSTYVIRMTPDYVELDSGGWHTVTTWNRMSEYGIRVAGSRKSGIVVFCRGENWETEGHPYYDGIRLTADGTALLEDQPELEPMMEPVKTVSGWTGMDRSESRRARDERFAMLTGQRLRPISESNGVAVYEMRQSDIAACPHYIMVPEHYRADGSCRCDDSSHTEMEEWGYTWNGSRWVA